MRSVRRLGLLLAALGIVAGGAARAGAQATEAYLRGQDLESRNDFEGAARAYREALAQSPASLPAMLGLERVYAELGRSDSLLPILDSAIAQQPRLAALRAAQLRTLRTLGNRDGTRAAFERWRHDVPHDPSPYREYARMLIQDGFTAQADTVLREAQADIGSGRGFEYELAQLNAAMGRWLASAHAWRAAVADNPYLAEAAVYALMPTPQPQRDSVRLALAAPPPAAGPLRVLSSLEIGWGAPQAGWDALRSLRPDSAVVAAWLDFAHRAEENEAWLVARDALVAVAGVTPSDSLLARAAADAVNGGDAAGALPLAERAEHGLDSTTAAATVLPVHLRALAALGRPAEAERLLAAYSSQLGPQQRSQYSRLLAWGYVRRGDLVHARAALAEAGGEGDDAAEGWIALYEGALATARKRLRPSADPSPELISALAVLSRTQADTSSALGQAFLTLARGDTLPAADAFTQAAHALPDAKSLLLSMAARLYAAHNAGPKAIAVWTVIVDSLADSPEAPEADLEWARALRRSGQGAAAIQRLEHLIITYPESALVPQARRELDLARRAVPSSS